MEIYFLRHGLAGQHGDPKYKDDSLRPLTPKGQKELKRSARGMKGLGLQFDVIASSPYVRARQTAEIIIKNYPLKKKIFLTSNLLPPATIHQLLKEILSQFPQAERILLVGHEPHLTRMISSLLKSKQALSIDFRKGGLCLVTSGEREAVFQWLLTPEQMGLIKKQ